MKKRILSLVLTICMLMIIFVQPIITYANDNFKFTLNGDTLTISGNGSLKYIPSDMYDEFASLKYKAKEVVFKDGITEIGEIFTNQTSLEKVTLPKTLKSLGIYTFRGCTNLKEVEFPDAEFEILGGTFERCTNLKEVYIPAGATLSGYLPFGYSNYDGSGKLDLTIYTPENSNAYKYAKENGINVVVSTRAEFNKKFSIAAPVELTPIKSDKSLYKEPSFKDIKTVDEYTDYIVGLGYLNLFKGDERGNFNPESTITRAEFSAIVCRMLGYESEATKHKGKTVFNDVPGSHWASGYIFVASQLGIINGYGNGLFGPEDPVTYEQAIKMIVCAIGYNKVDFCVSAGVACPDGTIPYPDGYMAIAQKYNLIDSVYKIGNNAPRKLIAKLLYIALNLPSVDTVGNVSIKGDSLLKKIFGIDSEKDIEEIIKDIIDKLFKSENIKDPVEKDPEEKKEPIFEIEKVMQKENKTFENEPPIDRNFKKPDLTEEEAFERIKGTYIWTEHYGLVDYCGHDKAIDITIENGYNNGLEYVELKYDDNGNFIALLTGLSNNEPFIQWKFSVIYDTENKVYYGKKVLQKIVDSPIVVYQCFRIEEIDNGVYIYTHLNDNRFMGIGPESWSDDCSSLMTPVIRNDKHIYQIVEENYSWDNSNKYIDKLYNTAELDIKPYLATITSQDEHDFLVSHLEKGEEYWIGGYKDNEMFSWKTKEPFVYSQIKKDNGTYLTVNGDGTWNAYDSGKRNFIIEYYVTDPDALQPAILDFLTQNRESLEKSLRGRYSYHYWNDVMREDLIENHVEIFGKAINFNDARYNLIDFYRSGIIDYFGNQSSGGQQRYTAVLTDIILNTQTVKDLETTLTLEDVDVLIDIADFMVESIIESIESDEQLAKEYGANNETIKYFRKHVDDLKANIDDLKVDRQVLQSKIHKKKTELNNLDEFFTQDIDPLHRQTKKNIDEASELIEELKKIEHGEKIVPEINDVLAEKLKKHNYINNISDYVSIGADLFSMGIEGYRKMSTISALKKVKADYEESLLLIKEKTNDQLLKNAIDDVVFAMNQSFDETINDVVESVATEFLKSTIFEELSKEVVEMSIKKALEKLGVKAAGKIASDVVGGVATGVYWVYEVPGTAVGLAELIAGTSTQAKAAIDLKILTEIEYEVKRINSDYALQLANNQNVINQYVKSTDILKAVQIYGCYLFNEISTAEDKSFFNTVKRALITHEKYDSDFDARFEDEVKRINSISFIY